MSNSTMQPPAVPNGFQKSPPSSTSSSAPRRNSRFPSKKQERPFPKGDIDVKLQKKAQDLLMNASQNYSGFNASNLQIIAVSFEHKVFAESKNRGEYISKIKQKLNEWHFQDTANPPPAPVTANTNNSSNNLGNNSKVPSPPSTATSKHAHKKSSPGKERKNSQSKGSSGVDFTTPPPTSGYGSGFTVPTSPSFPAQQYSPLMSASSTGAHHQSGFMTLTDSNWLKTLDLNDENIRNQWVAAVTEYIYAEAWNSLPTRGANDGMDLDQNLNGYGSVIQMSPQQPGHQQIPHGQGQQQQDWNMNFGTDVFGVGQINGNGAGGDGMFGGLSGDAQFNNDMMNGNWMNRG